MEIKVKASDGRKNDKNYHNTVFIRLIALGAY